MVTLNSKSKVAVFISGRGSNLKALIKNSKLKRSKYKISLVLSNKSNAKGLDFAKKNKIKNYFIEKKLSNFENRALKLIKINKIKIICLAGFMRILSPNFIKKAAIPIINIHPSLLPKLKGLNTHERAIKAKYKFSGCTVHYVNEKLDSGKIIIQKRVRVFKSDNPKSLAKKILKLEHKAYAEALQKII
ncbi:phosphoribosylglycinamide formyltransferase [Candidatus Pelagibacter sp. HIMB1517]|uniref:phosphoribosylglycinamide formyltransferase n=1 Tax=Candidatus Pelagibacter sp. HIMB1517 TaxID=3413341 RepID=UPI003F872694